MKYLVILVIPSWTSDQVVTDRILRNTALESSVSWISLCFSAKSSYLFLCLPKIVLSQVCFSGYSCYIVCWLNNCHGVRTLKDSNI